MCKLNERIARGATKKGAAGFRHMRGFGRVVTMEQDEEEEEEEEEWRGEEGACERFENEKRLS